MERFWKVSTVCLGIYSLVLTWVVLRLAADLYGQIFETEINPWDARPALLGSSFIWLVLVAAVLLAVCAVVGVAGLLARKVAAEQGHGGGGSEWNSAGSLASQGREDSAKGGVNEP